MGSLQPGEVRLRDGRALGDLHNTRNGETTILRTSWAARMNCPEPHGGRGEFNLRLPGPKDKRKHE